MHPRFVVRAVDLADGDVRKLLHDHTVKLWSTMNTPEHLNPESLDVFLAFLAERRRPAAFFAYDGESVVGSSLCYLMPDLLPPMLKQNVRAEGYIANLWVDEQVRRRNIGSALAEHAVGYLERSGCTRVHVAATDAAERLFGSLGFVHRNVEMVKTFG